MGAPIRTSTSDVPDFSTYPAAPSDHLLSAPQDSRLQDVATQVGSRLGEGVSALRNLQERMMYRMDELRDVVSDLAGSFRDHASDVAHDKIDQVREQSRAQFQRAKRYAEARPLAVIAAAGVAGLLLGISARAWRERRG